MVQVTLTSWLLIASAIAIVLFALGMAVHVGKTIDLRGKTLADETRAKQADALQERGFKYGDRRDVIE